MPESGNYSTFVINRLVKTRSPFSALKRAAISFRGDRNAQRRSRAKYALALTPLKADDTAMREFLLLPVLVTLYIAFIPIAVFALMVMAAMMYFGEKQGFIRIGGLRQDQHRD